MFPWFGNVPGMQQQQGGQQGMQSMLPWLLMQHQQRGGGAGMSPFGGQQPQLDWSNPSQALSQLQTRFTDRFGDNQGLSGLWSSRSPTTFSPGGWGTTTTQGDGGGIMGGLLGKLFG